MTKDKIPLMTGKRAGKRVMACVETMQKMGQNPFENVARIAAKAEMAGDYATAGRAWQYLGDFLDAKRKPVDPTEQAQKHKQIATLEELTKIKAAILAGAASGEKMIAFEEKTVIDAETVGSVDDLI